MWKHKYLLSTLEPSVEYFRFKAGLFNPNLIREALTSLRGKIDDLWIMIIPDWLRSGFGKFGDVLRRVYFIAWVSVVAILYWTFHGSEHCSKQLIIWLPQNIYCGIPSPFQFSNNVCFYRITLNSSIINPSFVNSVFQSVIISKADYKCISENLAPDCLWTRDILSSADPRLSHFELSCFYSQILWFMSVNKSY